MKIPPFARKLAPPGFIFLLLISFHVDSKSQSSNSQSDDSVSVKSWKVGDSRVTEQVLALSLKKNLTEYEFDVYDTTKQKHFRLRLWQTYVNTIRKQGLPCWAAVFKEVVKGTKSEGNLIGYDLLSVEGPGVGDSFPRENWAPFLCPVEKPSQVFDGQLYPITAERKFSIEKFFLIFQVTDYQLDEKENRLNKLNLRIEFKNQEQN